MPPGSAPVPSLRRCVCTRRFIVAGPPKVLSGPCRQARRRHSAGGGLGIQLSCELWVGSRSPSTRDNRDARLKEPSLLPQLHSTVAIISHRLPCALRRCASACRPNRFGRSFGRKLGVLYDDYVKDVFVSACAINKKEREVVLHTQEVTGSSPVAPTIRIKRIHRRGYCGDSACDAD